MNVEQRLRTAGLSREYADISIPKAVILTLLTCGIYNLIWNYRQMAILNALLREERFSFAQWFLLTLLTCGIYHFYYEYKMGEAIKDLQEEFGHRVNESLSMISLLLSLFGLSLAADAIHQDEINTFLGSNQIGRTGDESNSPS